MERVDVNRIIGSLLIVGFMIGILYVNLFAVDSVRISGVFDESYLRNFIEQNLVMNEYIIQVVWCRLWPILFIVLLCQTRFSRITVMLMLLWFSFLFGCYMSMGIVVLGGKGIMLCVLSIFPHIFFYGVAYYLLFLSAFYGTINEWNLPKSITLLLCMVCGIVIECNLNPIILKWFIGLL